MAHKRYLWVHRTFFLGTRSIEIMETSEVPSRWICDCGNFLNLISGFFVRPQSPIESLRQKIKRNFNTFPSQVGQHPTAATTQCIFTYFRSGSNSKTSNTFIKIDFHVTYVLDVVCSYVVFLRHFSLFVIASIIIIFVPICIKCVLLYVNVYLPCLHCLSCRWLLIRIRIDKRERENLLANFSRISAYLVKFIFA